MITPGFELVMPVDSLAIPDFDEGVFTVNSPLSASSSWSTKTSAQILDDISALLTEMNKTLGPPFENVGLPMEGGLVSSRACWAELLKRQRRSMVRLFLHNRRFHRPSRFTVKEFK